MAITRMESCREIGGWTRKRWQRYFMSQNYCYRDFQREVIPFDWRVTCRLSSTSAAPFVSPWRRRTTGAPPIQTALMLSATRLPLLMAPPPARMSWNKRSTGIKRAEWRKRHGAKKGRKRWGRRHWSQSMTRFPYATHTKWWRPCALLGPISALSISNLSRFLVAKDRSILRERVGLLC